MSREIPLTQGLVAIVDDEDYVALSKHKWTASKSRNTFYAMRNTYSLTGRKYVAMHRVVMGDPQGMEIDHINRDGLDNRKSNLRPVTKRQNALNRTSNKSGVPGVHWRKDKQKWCAQIRIAGKVTTLGFFTNIEDAGEAYQIAFSALR